VKELSLWMPWCGRNYSLQDCTTFVAGRGAAWEKGGEYDFVIYNPADGALLGGAGLNSVNREHRFANLGYWVRTSWTRRGVAPAAARLIARFGFEELKFVRLEIVAAVGNRPSQRVAEKAGAMREGILRNRLTLHEKQHDAVMYSLTSADLHT
jgi:RimJ/RimL family protein N-acetyltransferase